MRRSEPREISIRYSWFALAILFVLALSNYIDRTILSIMQVALKRDLGLSDTQLGTLTGLSFAIFYTTLALPIARIADRVARKYVLAGALTIWTLMTAASSLAGGYLDKDDRPELVRSGQERCRGRTRENFRLDGQRQRNGLTAW